MKTSSYKYTKLLVSVFIAAFFAAVFLTYFFSSKMQNADPFTFYWVVDAPFTLFYFLLSITSSWPVLGVLASALLDLNGKLSDFFIDVLTKDAFWGNTFYYFFVGFVSYSCLGLLLDMLAENREK